VSHDSDHAHFGTVSHHEANTRAYLWPTGVRNLESVAVAVAEIFQGGVKF